MFVAATVSSLVWLTSLADCWLEVSAFRYIATDSFPIWHYKHLWASLSYVPLHSLIKIQVVCSWFLAKRIRGDKKLRKRVCDKLYRCFRLICYSLYLHRNDLHMKSSCWHCTTKVDLDTVQKNFGEESLHCCRDGSNDSPILKLCSLLKCFRIKRGRQSTKPAQSWKETFEQVIHINNAF